MEAARQRLEAERRAKREATEKHDRECLEAATQVGELQRTLVEMNNYKTRHKHLDKNRDQVQADLERNRQFLMESCVEE